MRQKIRHDFPVLKRKVNGKPLIYFDNAATTQKPSQVIEKISNYYSNYNANVHRGIHKLSEEATEEYEGARAKIAKFVNAKANEIVFTKNTTESLNILAYWALRTLKKGDEIVLTVLEHHSNIVPWQLIAEEKSATIRVIPVNEKGEILLDEFDSLLTEKTAIVAVNMASNALGTINPIKEIIQKAHEVGAKVLIDAAQAAAHLDLNVQDLHCDFLAFSAHKMYGPTGVGVLYGKKELLEKMPPYQGGGEMISEVTFKKTTWNNLPYKFEAGTPDISGVVALSAAIDFIENIGKENIRAHENSLLDRFLNGIENLNQSHEKKIKLIGTASEKVSVQSFLVGNIHPFDAGMMLDARGIAVRTGHHCTQPLMARFKIEGTVRASFAVYNTIEEVDTMILVLGNMLKR